MRAKFLALMALVLGMVSCQNDFDGANVGNQGEVDFTLNVAVPELTTRAAGSSSAASGLDNIDLDSDYDVRYILEVYDANGALAKERFTNYEDKAATTSFNLRLIPGRKYTFVVWADFVLQQAREEGKNYDLHYVTTNADGLKNVTVNDASWGVIDESRDAYTGKHTEDEFKSSSSITVNLTRPFAKLRVVTTDIKELGPLMPKTATVNYTSKLYTSFNAYTATAGDLTAITDAKVVDFATDTYGDEANPKAATSKGEMTLFADYFFGAEDDKVLFTMDVVDSSDQAIPTIVFNTNIPVQRNYLTTVKGPILTDSNNITVTIDDVFDNVGDGTGTDWNPEEDDFDVDLWNGTSMSAPVDSDNDGVYEIGTGAQLAYLAAAVNGTLPSTASTRAEVVNWAKEEYVLTANINLDNNNWTPIGISESLSFRGSFDGQGYTISNICIDSKSCAGLFGYVGSDPGSNDGTIYGAIRNLKLHNVKMNTSKGAALCGNLFRGEISDIELTGKVTIEGTNQNVAGVVGYHYGNLANITVDVTEDSYVKGAIGYCGGVAAYSGEGDYTNTNIKSNIKVISSGEAVGGLFALLQYGNSVTDCSCSATVVNDCAVDSHNRYVRTGGIAGCWNENTSDKTTLTNCKFTGTIHATRQDGLTASKLAHGGLVGVSYNTAGYGELNIDGKKYVDVYTSDGLAKAVKLEGYTIFMTAGPWNNGASITEYTMPTSVASNVTIEGVKEAILNMNNLGEVSGANNLTIDGITVKWNGANYTGFTHSTGHVYKNVTFNGAFFCWNQSARFEDCTFNLNANQYIWTYGCNVDFERCVFNCVDGKGILIYNEGTDVTVNINNCEFSSSKHAQTGNGQNIAAIEINNAVNNPKFTVSINDCVSHGGFAYDDFICRFKDEVTAENLENLNVTVDGYVMFPGRKVHDETGLYWNGETKPHKQRFYVHNAEELAKATAYFAGQNHSNEANTVTIDLVNDIDLAGVEWNPWSVMFITVNGNNHTISNLSNSFFGYAGAVTVNDLTLENVTASGNQAGTFVASAEGAKFFNCFLKGNNKVTFVDDAKVENGVGAISGITINSNLNVTITEGTNVEVDMNTISNTEKTTFDNILTGYKHTVYATNSGTITNNGNVSVKVAEEIIANSEGTGYSGELFEEGATDFFVLQNSTLTGDAKITIKRTYHTVALEGVTANINDNLIVSEVDNTIILHDCDITLAEGKKLIVTVGGATIGQVMIHNVKVNGEMLTQQSAANFMEGVNWYEVW